MARGDRGPPGPTDADAGLWQGRQVARRFVSPDGLVVLVGKSAEDNDVLSLKLASPRDFWLHVASGSGSHVVVRNPEGLERLPRETAQFAAALAARYSKARAGGRVAVHLTICREVGKPRGLPAGKVTIGRFRTVHAAPLPEPPEEGSES
jgi:predicted ribosome quality control (RQC) complex YloA/Tae2 family protein